MISRFSFKGGSGGREEGGGERESKESRFIDLSSTFINVPGVPLVLLASNRLPFKPNFLYYSSYSFKVILTLKNPSTATQKTCEEGEGGSLATGLNGNARRYFAIYL